MIQGDTDTGEGDGREESCEVRGRESTVQFERARTERLEFLQETAQYLLVGGGTVIFLYRLALLL